MILRSDIVTYKQRDVEYMKLILTSQKPIVRKEISSFYGNFTILIPEY